LATKTTADEIKVIPGDEPHYVGISQRDVKYWVYHPFNSNLWRVHIEQGRLPLSLLGKYTTKKLATEAVIFYLEHVQREIVTSKNRASKPKGQKRKNG